MLNIFDRLILGEIIMKKLANRYRTYFTNRPETLIVYSFLSVIVIGAFLLSLPVASRVGRLSLIDALFMSTSAVCVTGLTLVDIGRNFTLFGQLVLLCLIQLGGLGIMTFSLLFLVLIGRKVSLRSRRSIVNLSPNIDLQNFKYSLSVIFIMAFVIEAIGASLLFLHFKNIHSVLFAAYSSVFHSISAFCNAGFSLYSDSFVRFNNQPYVLFVMIGLIVLGGLGFIVIDELINFYKKRRQSSRLPLSLHTKIALIGSLFFTAFGFCFIWSLERSNLFADMPSGQQFLNALFLSVTSRTAGFNTVETSLLANPTLFFVIILMFVGGCPGSTAGGIKIHTAVSLIAFAKDKLKGLSMASIFNRKIPNDVVDRAMTVLVVSSLIVMCSFFVIEIAQSVHTPHILVGRKEDFLDLLFESISAFGTVGLSTGATSKLTFLGKIITILLMFSGRLGPLTIGIALQIRQKKKIKYEFPQEEIMIN